MNSLFVGSRLLLECLLLARTWTFESTDQIWSRLNQEHTNHAEAELAEIQKVNLKGEIVKIAIIPTPALGTVSLIWPEVQMGES